MADKRYWVKDAFKYHKRGSLHRQLGIPQKEKIPVSTLKKIVGTKIGNKANGKTVTLLLKRRASLALTARGFKRRGKKKKAGGKCRRRK